MKSNLNIRQRKFIDNLFQGMSQKKAYKEAGYEGNDSCLETNASHLIRNHKVTEEIERRLKDIDYRNRVRLGRISESALAELLVIIKNESVEHRIKLDAIKDALDRAGLKPVERFEQSGTIRAEIVKVASREDRDQR